MSRSWWEKLQTYLSRKTDGAIEGAKDTLHEDVPSILSAFRINSRLGNQDQTIQDIAANARTANDKQLDEIAALIKMKYQDSFAYVQESGGFWTKNIWMPVLSFFQKAFGVETATEKLKKHQQLVDQAKKEIRDAVITHRNFYDDKTQKVLEGSIGEARTGTQNALDATTEAYEQRAEKDKTKSQVLFNTATGEITPVPSSNTHSNTQAQPQAQVEEPAGKGPTPLEFTYDYQ